MKSNWNHLKYNFLQGLSDAVQKCRRCPLHLSRKNAVTGEGYHDASIMLVGEAPGEEEDRLGRPFVGRSGRLLSRLLEEAGIERDEVYITNVVKCRPPKNRTPSKEEVQECIPYLREQVKVIAPRVIVCLGATASKWILGESFSRISLDRGKIIEARRIVGGLWGEGGPLTTIVIPTFHPSYILRNPQRKQGSPGDLVVSDLRKAMMYSTNMGRGGKEDIAREK